MSKVKQQITDKVDKSKLTAELNRLGRLVFTNYTFDSSELSIRTVGDAIAVRADEITAYNKISRASNSPYINLSAFNFMQKDELLIIYDIEANYGRLPAKKEVDEYLDTVEKLTPASIRRWYANRKAESEYLVTDYNGANFWLAE